MKSLQQNEDKSKECIERAKELLFKGHTQAEIHVDLLCIDSKLRKAAFDEIIAEAYKQLYKALHRDREYIFQLHMSRYEELYKRSTDMVDKHGMSLNAKDNWPIIVGRYQTAMRILKLKEDLLGVHNKDLVIEIENNNTTIIDDGESGKIKMKDLTLEEKIELLSMLKEIRTVPIEGDRQIVIKKKTLNETNEVTEETQSFQESAIDIQYEEMPEKVIDKIKPDQEEEEVKYIQSPVVEDYVDRSIANKTLEQVTGAINTDLKEKFEKLMSRKLPKK